MRVTQVAVVLAATGCLARPQVAVPERPTFEVASVKLSGAQSVRGSSGGPGTSDPGQYRFTSATMLDLLAVAYNIEYFQISSKTPLDRTRFDLAAKLPAGATKQEFRVMLQNLLKERFHLKSYMESRDFPAYELVVGKTGAKLKETGSKAAHKDGFPVLPPDRPGMAANNSISGGYILVRISAQDAPISSLVRILRSSDDPPVVDNTGLTGKYDFTLEYTKEMSGAMPGIDSQAPVAPNLSPALQQQLGLQLVGKKISFDIVVVESVDKLPTEN